MMTDTKITESNKDSALRRKLKIETGKVERKPNAGSGLARATTNKVRVPSMPRMPWDQPRKEIGDESP